MNVRFLVGLLVAVSFATGASAADLAQPAPVEEPQRRCNVFNDYFIFGDPTACEGFARLPMCDDPKVVRRAKAFVSRAEPIYLEPEIAEISHIAENPQRVPLASPLVRRYCTARVRLTNGDHTTAYYFLQEDAGFVGLSWKIYVCLDGYDAWRIYDGANCRVARPASIR